MTENYQICSSCIMDTSDPEICFDDQGDCNYCLTAREMLPSYRFTKDRADQNLSRLRDMIKKKSGTESYDCIIGLSGGVDSSYVALLARDMGLKPLCVHFDNGWNTEAAVVNVRKIVEHCGFELFTYVINWEEFRDLQRSFLKAGVIDLEMLSDHAIFASLFKLRRQFGIKYVLSGTNFTTENGLPNSWIWSKMDTRNIKDIHRKYGTVRLKTFPLLSSFRWGLIKELGLGGVFLEPLNLINYTKEGAMLELEKVGWRYYGGKHYESIITKFYQSYILPIKFGVDKRRCHHSALIRNGEMDRAAALLDLEKPALGVEVLASEKKFVCKKLGFTESEFDSLMEEPPVAHDRFKTDRYFMQTVAKVGKFLLRR